MLWYLLAHRFGALLLQRGIADFLSALPRPFLGVSSLNLAAPDGAAFFLLCDGRASNQRPSRCTQIIHGEILGGTGADNALRGYSAASGGC